MTLIVPICGEFRMLNHILNVGSAQENPVLRMFTNSTNPSNGEEIGSYTQLTSGAWLHGNSVFSVLSGPGWTLTSGTPSQGAFAERPFMFVESFGNVYGYYVVHSATAGGPTLLWAERFTGGPYNIVNSGDQIKITPVFTLT